MIKPIIEPRTGVKVLDVGNGGVRRFSSPQTTLYVGVDFSLDMLKKGENRTFYRVCGEATDLSFKKETFNTVLCLYLLHHLVKGSVGKTIEAVKKTLRESSICLQIGGNVIIAETCLPPFLEKIERVLFFLLRAVLLISKQPEVLLFSVETLTQILVESGYKEIRVWKVPQEKGSPWDWVRISIRFSALKIPRWMNPSRSTVIEAMK
jgi:ubiquinone/menaquinone biosynthesis C-methylase UbiE